jgi:exopolysaccharide biosynthesis polyprenyl glycosylphosphotransferase
MRGSAVAVKRLIDVLVAGALVLVLSPLMLTIAAAIKLRSPGPVFFRQKRLGRNKRRFNLYKFRTMVPDAEAKMAELVHLNEMNGPTFKIRNDPRVTPLGRFLRRTSLDELPQLFNVLAGHMSLVGPRPLPERDYESFSTAWHRRRFSVKPGMTCLWQVMGRNNIPFERWMELDLQYIDQWSLLLDLQILLKTIPAVMKGSGAS